MKATTPLLLFFILLASPILAEIDIQTYPVGDGFSVVPGAQEVEVCQCSSAADSFVVRNTGEFASRFTIVGSGSEHVSISESSFELLPGETRTVHVFFQAPCSGLVDDTVTFRIADVFGNSYDLQKRFLGSKCQNLEATLVVDEQGPVQPCQVVTYEVIIQNPGVFTETYDVSFGGKRYDEYFGTPYQEVVIPPGKTGSATTALHLPCSMSGDFTIPFTVQARQNELSAQLEHALTVTPSYGFNTTLEAPERLCREDWDELYLTVRNDAPFNNTFDLSVAGADFLSLQESSVSLGSGEEAVVEVYAAPTNKAEGEREVSVTVKDRTTGSSQVVSRTLPLRDCYGVSVNVDLQQDVNACAGYHEFPLIIQNTGAEEEAIEVSAQGPYAAVEDGELTLAPGASGSATLVMDVPVNASLEADVSVTAAVAGLNVSASDTLGVSFADEYGCFQPLISPSSRRVGFDAQSVTFTIENDGLSLAEYDVRFEGSEDFSLQAQDEYVVLQPGESENLTLTAQWPEDGWQQRYDGVIRVFTTSAEDDEVLEYAFPVTVRVHGKSLFVRWGEHFSQSPCQLGTLLLLLAIVVLSAIIIARPSVHRRHDRRLLAVLLALWGVTLVVFLFVQGLPPPLYDDVAQDPDDPLTLYVEEDGYAQLNLSRYFVDPDEDLLEFTVSDIDNVTVTVANGTATFYPDPDWSGTRRFRVSAFDGQGGMTESPRMSLVVVDRPEYDGWSLYERYCGYLNLLLLLLLAFLIYAVAAPRRKPLPPVAHKQHVRKKK